MSPSDAGQASPRGPGRPRTGSEDKRERILVEASRIFARQGYAATSLADIAVASEISKAGLLHHFGSKEVLFSAVLERQHAADRVGLDIGTGSVWDFLDRWVELAGRNATVPGMVGLHTAMVAGGVDPENPAHPWLHRHFIRSVGLTEEELERGKSEGHVAPDAPSRELARGIVAMSDGIQLQWLCARADAAAAGAADGGGVAPIHGGAAVDMAEQMRLLVDAIKSRWAVSTSSE